MKKTLPSIVVIAFFLISQVATAYDGDISINNGQIRFSTSGFMEGSTTRIYATVHNLSNSQDLLGTVRFFENNKQIGTDQSISIFKGGTDDVFTDWTPSTFGRQNIAVKLYPWEKDIDNPGNNWVSTSVYVEQDTDHDKIPNQSDPDDDGDGVNDTEDLFPLDSTEWTDTDGDGIGNNADLDDDNDDVPDEFDDVPLDPDETIDTDKDGIGNIADKDDDNDGIDDRTEENQGLDPLMADTDSDGSIDPDDAFPLDPDESIDTDNDKIGNNSDPDDDNDGIFDIDDDFPLNKGPVIKLNMSNSELEEQGLMEEFIIDASDSYDEDGRIVSYIWEVDGVKKMEGQAIKQSFTTKGLHSIKLTLSDDHGQKISKNLQVNVSNLRFTRQLISVLLASLLACLLLFKYITGAKKAN